MRKLKVATAMTALFIFAAPAASQPPQLVVQVWSFGIAPNPIHLAAGKAVTLTFVNQSGSGHDFTAPGFFRHSQFIGGDAPVKDIELAPHQSRSVTLVPSAGTWEAHCSHFLHKQMGMSDTIVVD